MAQITITEALAELNTIQKRVEKKQQYVRTFLSRPEGLKDPLEKSGGSVKVISQELQGINDLLKRHLCIRLAIQKKNHETHVKIGEATMSVAEWLTWRKEIAPQAQSFNTTLIGELARTRQQAQQRGHAVVSATATVGDAKPQDILVNVDEARLASEAETLEETLGKLDGQLSLINATTTIDV